MTEQCNTVLGY